jgi:protein-export membrane protein SecD
MNIKQKLQLKFAGIVVLAVFVGLVSYPQAVSKVTPVYNLLNKTKIKLGLDLQGGIHLEYKADVSQLDPSKITDAMQGAQDVIERRVNAFGVSEPLVYTTKSGSEYRVNVDLPGVKDIEQAKQQIKETPLLEFKEEGIDPQAQQFLDSLDAQTRQTVENYPQFKYKSTGLTGRNLKNASVTFQSQGLGEPQISLQFDSEGTKLFADLTKKNLGKTIGIFLDGNLIEAPTVQAEITNGEAVITGSFTLQAAKDLVQKLNTGALPVPLSLVSQQSVEATLGADSLRKILVAGIIAGVAVVVFMLLFYRFLGLVASLALLIYTGLMITIFKFFGITLTLPGIAGFVLSIGMAVDANILIFERTKEEIRHGRTIANSLDEGFKRAWTSIRDGNISSLLTAGILYLMGTGFVKSFAASLFIGVVVSMFTAVMITRTMLKFIISDWIHGRVWMVGVRKKDIKQ